MRRCSLLELCLLGSAFGLPDVPFPLLEMSEAIDSEKRDWAIIFIAVVR